MAELNSQINGIKLNVWEQGGTENGDNANYGYPAGSLFVTDDRITSRYIDVKSGEPLKITVNSGYRAILKSWNGVDSEISDKTGWIAGNFTWPPNMEGCKQ